MRPSRFWRGVVLAGVSSAALCTAEAPARAQQAGFGRRPPTATAPPAAPPSPPAASGVPDAAGIAVGSPMATVDAKCKEPGVKCLRSTRTVGAVALDRVRVDLPASSEFSRVFVTGLRGTVLGVMGRYRTADKGRLTTLRGRLGPGVSRRGALAWAAPTGVVTQLGLRGNSVLLVDTRAATAKGLAVNPQAFLASAPHSAPSGPSQTAPLSPSRASSAVGRVGDLAAEVSPTARTTQTLRFPVKITLLKLTCFDENDWTSIFHGDDPYLNVVGTHSSLDAPRPWFEQRAFSDVESGDTKTVNLAVFPEGDPRRSIAWGEAVGVQVTLLEGDIGNNDEIDFAYPIIDYPTAREIQGKPYGFTEELEGDGAKYKLSFKIEVGAGVNDPAPLAAASRYRQVDAPLWSGSFAGSVGDGAAKASLSFLGSRDPATPSGILYGTLEDAGVVASVRTTRLQGDSLELFVRYPSGAPGTLVGYLVGEGAEKRLVGTLVRDGVTRGVSLVRK